MTLDPMRISPETSLGAAMEIFDSHDFNGLPVLDADGELVGIVTKLDVLRAFRSTEEDFLPRYDQIIERPVAEVMTRNPQVVTPRQHLSDVLGKLVSSRSKSFPVVDAGRLVHDPERARGHDRAAQRHGEQEQSHEAKHG